MSATKSIAAKFWLVKSEPDVYSIDHLAKDQTTWWESVRNYQARNFMMNEMSVGDLVLFYHSNADPSGIVGLAKVSKAAAPDQTQFDKKSETYDPKATQTKPRWFCVQVSFEQKFPKILSLQDLKEDKALAEMLLLQRGQRLSVQPVSPAHFARVLKMTTKK